LRSIEMLLIETTRIPPEGLDVDEALDPARLRLEGESDFALDPGARVRAHVELVDGSTVHVRGRLEAGVSLECGRCLDRYGAPAGQELDLFFLPREKERPRDEEEDVQLSDREVVVGYYEGDRLDLADVIREQLILSLPLRRLCREECRGLCPTCGKNRNSSDCGCPPPEDGEDPRLAPLRRLFGKN
jgi:uncharacterized protein